MTEKVKRRKNVCMTIRTLVGLYGRWVAYYWSYGCGSICFIRNGYSSGYAMDKKESGYRH